MHQGQIADVARRVGALGSPAPGWTGRHVASRRHRAFAGHHRRELLKRDRNESLGVSPAGLRAIGQYCVGRYSCLSSPSPRASRSRVLRRTLGARLMSSRLAEGLDRPRRIKRERRPQRSGRAPIVLPILRRGPLRGTATPRATLGGQRGSGGRACGSGVRALALRTVTSDGRKTRFDAGPTSPPCLGVGLQEPKDHSAKQGFENHPDVVQEDRLRDRRGWMQSAASRSRGRHLRAGKERMPFREFR